MENTLKFDQYVNEFFNRRGGSGLLDTARLKKLRAKKEKAKAARLSGNERKEMMIKKRLQLYKN